MNPALMHQGILTQLRDGLAAEKDRQDLLAQAIHLAASLDERTDFVAVYGLLWGDLRSDQDAQVEGLRALAWHFHAGRVPALELTMRLVRANALAGSPHPRVADLVRELPGLAAFDPIRAWQQKYQGACEGKMVAGLGHPSLPERRG
jgi:hypothetical protein